MPLPDRSELARLRDVFATGTLRLLGKTPILRDIAFSLWEKRWFFIALIVAFAVGSMTPFAGLSENGQIILAIILFSLILLISETVPLPMLALIIIIAQILFLGRTSDAVGKSLFSDSILFLFGALMISVAIVRQRLDRKLAYLVLQITGTKTLNIAFGLTIICALLASLIGEHTVAALMLPVVLALISFTSSSRKKVRRLAALLLLAVAYGSAIGSIGSPVGAPRNGIVIAYMQDILSPATTGETHAALSASGTSGAEDTAAPRQAVISFGQWMQYTYPIMLLQIPVLMLILFFTFRPEVANLSKAAERLKKQIRQDGPIRRSDILTIFIVLTTFICWILYSDKLGLGPIALLGAVAFLLFGIVRWEEMNSGVNFGVVLLYGATVSLGMQMYESGLASWLSGLVLPLAQTISASGEMLFWGFTGFMSAAFGNIMASSGAVALVTPVSMSLAEQAGQNQMFAGLVTAISSSFAYLTVIGTPACTIVYAAGYLKATDFFKAGAWMLIASLVILMLVSGLYWPFLAG